MQIQSTVGADNEAAEDHGEKAWQNWYQQVKDETWCDQIWAGYC